MFYMIKKGILLLFSGFVLIVVADIIRFSMSLDKATK